MSFDSDDPSYILGIISDMGLDEYNIIPIAEDPFGNIFGFRFESAEKYDVVFYDAELVSARKICNTFTEFLNMIHE